jgi:hypothetical protein
MSKFIGVTLQDWLYFDLEEKYKQKKKKYGATISWSSFISEVLIKGKDNV